MPRIDSTLIIEHFIGRGGLEGDVLGGHLLVALNLEVLPGEEAAGRCYYLGSGAGIRHLQGPRQNVD